MPFRLPSLLALLALAAATAAEAAPAPFARPELPPAPAVQLRGRLAAAEADVPPFFVVSQADYQALAARWKIAAPPEVHFRTQILVVTAYRWDSRPHYDLTASGDLRVTVTPDVDLRSELGRLVRRSPSYEIKSFPRAAVRSLNGVPVPRQR
jgi:hypothetical protein